MRGTGLDPDGCIAREGDLARIPRAFAPVVDAARAAILDAFGPDRLHSGYLYGSIPRGTAVAGVSDLDVLLAFHDEPGDADRTAATGLERTLDTRFPQINGAGIELASAATLLSDIERHDLGWFVACLCTPFIGEDLASRLPRYRPNALLARETNGDLCDLLPGWRDQLSETATDAELHALSRRVSRRLVRTGFTLVMPRFGGWTSDLRESASVFGRYYPRRQDQMLVAVTVARTTTATAACSACSSTISEHGSRPNTSRCTGERDPGTKYGHPQKAEGARISATCARGTAAVSCSRSRSGPAARPGSLAQ